MKKFSENDKLYQYWRQGIDAYTAWQPAALVDRYYYENVQWSEDEEAELKKINQPMITVNHIFPKINMLTGLLLQNRPSIHCFPRGKDDAEVAATATKVVKYIFDINNLQTRQLEAFTDMATAGIGWLEARASSLAGRDPLVIDYVPWQEMVTDPLSRQPDYSDARFVCRGKYVDADMCLEFFPQAKKIIATKSTGPFSVDSTAIPGTQDQEWYDQQRDRVYLIEIQYKEFEKTDCFWDGFQLTKYIPSVHDPLLNEKFGRIVNTKIIVVKQAFILNDYIIFEQDLPYLFNNFTFVPFVAQRDSQGNPLSLVRYLKDMQDEINKRRSKVLHYLTAKRVLAEEGAVADVNEFMEELGHPDAFLQYRKGYEIKVEQDLEIGAQHFQLMHEAADEISQISGIYPDFQGMPTNARTGEAIRQRVVQSRLQPSDTSVLSNEDSRLLPRTVLLWLANTTLLNGLFSLLMSLMLLSSMSLFLLKMVEYRFVTLWQNSEQM